MEQQMHENPVKFGDFTVPFYSWQLIQPGWFLVSHYHQLPLNQSLDLFWFYAADDDPLMAIFGSGRISVQSSQQSLFNSPIMDSRFRDNIGSQDLFSSVSSSQGDGIDKKIDLTLQVCINNKQKFSTLLLNEIQILDS